MASINAVTIQDRLINLDKPARAKKIKLLFCVQLLF